MIPCVNKVKTISNVYYKLRKVVCNCGIMAALTLLEDIANEKAWQEQVF